MSRLAVVREVAAVAAEVTVPTDMMTAAEVAAWLRIPIGTWGSMVSRGTAPGGYRLGPRLRRGSRAEVATWLAARAGGCAR